MVTGLVGFIVGGCLGRVWMGLVSLLWLHTVGWLVLVGFILGGGFNFSWVRVLAGLAGCFWLLFGVGLVLGWVLTGGWLVRVMTRFGSDLGSGRVGCLGLRFTWLLLRFW